jgi:hypothetical protein
VPRRQRRRVCEGATPYRTGRPIDHSPVVPHSTHPRRRGNGGGHDPADHRGRAGRTAPGAVRLPNREPTGPAGRSAGCGDRTQRARLGPAAGAAARRGEVSHADHAASVRAGRAVRRHRRVPLLPGRPRVDRCGVPDRQPVPAPERRHRAPRDLLPGRPGGRAGRPAGRRAGRGGGLDLLRRRGHRRRRRVGGALGTGRRRDPAGAGHRLPRAARQPAGHAGALQPARRAGRGRSVRHPAPAHRPGPDAAGHHAAAGAGGTAVRARRVRPAVRSRGGGPRPRPPLR